MDHTLAPVTEIRNLSWSNSKTNENRGAGRSLPSEDGVWGELVLPSPSPTEAAWKSSSSAMTSQTGPLSPVSAGVDTLMDGSYVPIMVHSASSSCADSWSTSTGCADQDEAENDHYWDHCEQDSDDALAVPKLEPVEDDLDLNELKAAPLTPGLQQENGSSQPKQKRPRGRPRKHPLTQAASASKIAKGRSKTGCITCRKRKKKCDEAKPRCMNCEKNAVVCEGYHEKQIWKSGRERAEEERIRRDSLPVITMQPIFHGVETIEDKVFWKHYINHFSNVLTVEGETKNAFKDIILPLANQHQGLMHSILAVSSKHLDLDAPYGAKIMEENPGATSESLQKRADYHHDEAMRRLCEDMSKSIDKDDPRYQTVLAARYGQMLCLLLQTRADGNPRGEHRFHLQAYQTLIQHSPPEDPIFYTFITEFFQYHIYADDLFWYPETMTKRLSSDEWKPAAPIYPPRLLGVADGLFQHLSQITTIRNTIRDNMAAGIDPLVDYTSLYRAAEIDAAIREWTPRWPPGDSRERIGLLYKQVMWVYLFRTIYPPSSSPARRSTLGSLPPMTTPMPGMPQRRASMAATFGTASGQVSGMNSLFSSAQVTHSCPSSRNPSRTSSMHEQDSRSTSTNMPDRHRPPSPPPVRRPAQDDRRITLAVDESLAILESFKPSDPVQTLLLIPCMVIGTACFNKPQRDRIRTAIRAVRGYTGLRNCDRVSEVLEEVWALMDQGDWVAVWDWQSVASRMGYDFLCT